MVPFPDHLNQKWLRFLGLSEKVFISRQIGFLKGTDQIWSSGRFPLKKQMTYVSSWNLTINSKLLYSVLFTSLLFLWNLIDVIYQEFHKNGFRFVFSAVDKNMNKNPTQTDALTCVSMFGRLNKKLVKYVRAFFLKFS